MFVTKFDGVPQERTICLAFVVADPEGEFWEDAWSRSEPPEIGPDNSSP